MKRNSVLTLVMFGLILANFAALVASAQANPYVWVEDEKGDIRDIFVLGEKLRVRAYDGAASATNPYRVRLYYSPDAGVTWIKQKEWLSYQPNFDSGLLDDATNKFGRWKVEVRTFECKYAVGMYNVIPEVAFGVFGAIVACFSVLGLKSLRAKRKE